MQENYIPTDSQTSSGPTPKSRKPRVTRSLDGWLFDSIDIRAEKWIHILAGVILVLLIVGAAFIVISAFAYVFEGYSVGVFFSQLLLAFFIVVGAIIYWAVLKVLVNISNNLHIIRGNLEEINDKIED